MRFLFFLLIFSACSPVHQDSNTQPPSSTTVSSPPPLVPNRYNVALLIMDGVYNTELTAPYDIFQHTIFRKNIKAMNTFTVANTLDPITSFEGMRILPDYNYLSPDLPYNVASTTFPSDIPKYRKKFPYLDVRDSVLFVHDGKFITSAG